MTPLLFLPGSSGRGDFWDPIRVRLPDHESSAVDWPGLGGTPPDPRVSSFDDLVGFTIRKLTGPTALVGQSLGGYVAMRVALERPDLVSHLVLCVTSAGIDRAPLGLDEFRPSATSLSWIADEHQALDEQLRQVAIPTLLVWATDDAISPIAIGECLHELLPDSRLVRLDSDDHWVVHQYPDRVADEILKLSRPGSDTGRDI